MVDNIKARGKKTICKWQLVSILSFSSSFASPTTAYLDASIFLKIFSSVISIASYVFKISILHLII
jgi:hypothetical protein